MKGGREGGKEIKERDGSDLCLETKDLDLNAGSTINILHDFKQITRASLNLNFFVCIMGIRIPDFRE